MVVSYKKLWKLLIDKDLMKKDLQSNAGVSWATITKMSKGETVSTEVLILYCYIMFISKQSKITEKGHAQCEQNSKHTGDPWVCNKECPWETYFDHHERDG